MFDSILSAILEVTGGERNDEAEGGYDQHGLRAEDRREVGPG